MGRHALDDDTEEFSAVVDDRCALSLDKLREAQVFSRRTIQNICFAIRPVCRPHGDGAFAFRIPDTTNLG